MDSPAKKQIDKIIKEIDKFIKMAKKPKPVKKPKVQTAGDPVPPNPPHP